MTACKLPAQNFSLENWPRFPIPGKELTWIYPEYERDSFLISVRAKLRSQSRARHHCPLCVCVCVCVCVRARVCVFGAGGGV